MRSFEPMRFHALDSWRGIAALMVALLHFGMDSHVFGIPLVYNASLFVDFFFVLSGFVLSYAYGEALKTKISLPGYVIRRTGRLWPLHVAVICVLIAYELHDAWKIHSGTLSPRPLFSVEGGRDFSLLLQNIFLIQATGVTDRLGWNAPAWSISAELWVCFGFAALWVVIPRRALTAVASLAAASAFVVLIVFSPTYIATTLQFALLKCACGFFVGVLVHRIRDTVPELSGTGWEIAATTSMVAFLSLVTVEEPDIWTMLAPAVFGFVVLVFSYEDGLLSRLMKAKPLVWLGTLSYSIYMIHDTISWRMGSFVRACVVDRNIPGCSIFGPLSQSFMESRFFADLIALVYIAVVIILSILTYAAIEKPSRLFFNSIAKRADERSGKMIRSGSPQHSDHC